MKLSLQLTFLLSTLLIFSCQKEDTDLDKFPLKFGTNYGYYDGQGKEIIPDNYAYATVFTDGFAIVKLTGSQKEYAFIDERGQNVFNKTYRNATFFSEGLAWVAPKNLDLTAIDKDGKEKFSIKGAEQVKVFKENLAAYSILDSIGEKWGFVNTSGETVIKPQFFATGNFSNGLCAVKDKDENWGFIDKKGVFQIESKYKSAGDFANEKAIVQDQFEENFGVIDSKGNFIIKPRFQAILADNENYLVQLNDKWGWCNGVGGMIIDFKYDEAFKFGENDLAPVKSEGKFGYIDKKGNVVVKYQFATAYPFNGETAFVKGNDSVVGIINKKGDFVVKPKFQGISSDLVNYLNKEASEFETIKTDFFNRATILKNINVNNPENLMFGINSSEIAPKLYNKKLPADNEQDLTVFFLKKIAPDAYLSLYAMKNLNGDNKIKGFWYKVELDGRNFYKPNELEKALIKNLKGYTKIDAPHEFINQGVIKAYKNDKHILLVTGGSNTNEFYVEILDLSVNLDAYNSRSYGNHQRTDTDDLSNMKAMELELFRTEE